MKRVLLTFCRVALAVGLIAFLVLLFSPHLRLVGVVGLGVVVITATTWFLITRRSRPAAPPETRLDAAAFAEEFDRSTALRYGPTSHEDVNGRAGPIPW
jgi:hypothetical protein